MNQNSVIKWNCIKFERHAVKNGIILFDFLYLHFKFFRMNVLQYGTAFRYNVCYWEYTYIF